MIAVTEGRFKRAKKIVFRRIQYIYIYIYNDIYNNGIIRRQTKHLIIINKPISRQKSVVFVYTCPQTVAIRVGLCSWNKIDTARMKKLLAEEYCVHDSCIYG